MSKNRTTRRDCFDEFAELYAKARPAYPADLDSDLIDLAGLSSQSRVLEIGRGTGQLTIPLAERGVPIVAVELGVNLAAVALRKLSPFENATVVADFDNWRLPAQPFDLTVPATSFHWLNEARVDRCRDALRAGGTLAIIASHRGVTSSDDAFFGESQACYARWDPDYDPTFQPHSVWGLPGDAMT